MLLATGTEVSRDSCAASAYILYKSTKSNSSADHSMYTKKIYWSLH